MPPYVKSPGFVVYANPFYERISDVNCGELNLETGGQFFSGRPSNSNRRETEEDEEGPATITTAARFSYMLDRFERNALLIINSSLEVDNTMRNLTNSFKQYRFEVNVIEANKTRNKWEIFHEIRAFFEQDFTEIGAVAVVFLTSTRFKAFAKLQNGKLREQDVMKYFTSKQPVGLRGKPKIFIKEGICITEEYSGNEPYEIPASTNFEDILIIQANMIYHVTNLRPLDLLCAHLNCMKRRNLMEELHKVRAGAGLFHSIRYTIPIMQFKTTLTRELLLERTEESRAPIPLIKPSEEDVKENLAMRTHIPRNSFFRKKMIKFFYSKYHWKTALNPRVSST